MLHSKIVTPSARLQVPGSKLFVTPLKWKGVWTPHFENHWPLSPMFQHRELCFSLQKVMREAFGKTHPFFFSLVTNQTLSLPAFLLLVIMKIWWWLLRILITSCWNKSALRRIFLLMARKPPSFNLPASNPVTTAVLAKIPHCCLATSTKGWSICGRWV